MLSLMAEQNYDMIKLERNRELEKKNLYVHNCRQYCLNYQCHERTEKTVIAHVSPCSAVEQHVMREEWRLIWKPQFCEPNQCRIKDCSYLLNGHSMHERV